MKKSKIILIVICVFIFIYLIGGVSYPYLKKKYGNTTKKEIKSTAQIKGFNYLLYDNDPIIYKNEFKLLKSNLESKKINYEEYAKSISKMFIIDLYNLNGKKNMYDIGGVEFVYPDAVENYKLNVTNTLYKYMKDNTDGKRKQELPIVKNVEINNFEDTKFTIGEEEFDGYKIKLNIEYEKDLGYDKEAEVIIVKKDKYLYVVEKD